MVVEKVEMEEEDATIGVKLMYSRRRHDRGQRRSQKMGPQRHDGKVEVIEEMWTSLVK